MVWPSGEEGETRKNRLQTLRCGRFPFNQIFWFEIPGIPFNEWNSISWFVGLTNPRSSGSKFRAKIRDQIVDSFTFVYLLWGCSFNLKEVTESLCRKQGQHNAVIGAFFNV